MADQGHLENTCKMGQNLENTSSHNGVRLKALEYKRFDIRKGFVMLCTRILRSRKAIQDGRRSFLHPEMLCVDVRLSVHAF